MSAYGDIDGPSSASRLSPKTFALARSDACVTVYHLLKGDLRQDASLVSYLREIFNSVVEAGQTYPQEAQQSEEQFANYFFSADLFLGVFDNASPERASRSWQEVSALRDWPGTVAGMYYVKPNYPGRSAHICNAGFVVPTASRGRKVGLALGRSFLHFAPRLGFRASVFNLCYVSNTASVRIWDALGFHRAGVIPEAGRLKSADGKSEIYTDAIVFYRTLSVDEVVE